MTDYNSLTVANLRIILKERNIPSTGLTRKAQIIAKLQEQDAAAQEPVDEPPQAADAPIEPPAQPEAPPHPAPEAVAEPESVPDASQPPIVQSLEPPVAATANVVPVPVEQVDESSEAQTSVQSKEEPVKHTPVPVTQRSVTDLSSSQVDTDTEESKKRKRRSVSPPLNSREASIKKAKYLEGVVHLKEDGLDAPITRQGNGNTVGNGVTAEKHDSKDVDMAENGDRPVLDTKQPTEVGMADSTASSAGKPVEGATAPSDEPGHSVSSPKHERKASKDARYQTLFRAEKSEAEPAPALEDFPTPSPAIHPATRALYIRNFQRPLQLNTLRSHLTALATSSEAETPLDPIELLHIDSIKTHCFVALSTQAAAARIRAGLHNQVWPKESDRKALWADYIPEEKVQEWIDIESGADSGPRAGGRRWEVVYETREGQAIVELREVGSASGRPHMPSRNDRGNPAPSSDLPLPSAPSASKLAQAQDVAKPFVTLDKLFSSTTAKPMLYYKPVKDELVEKRKEELAAATSKDWSIRNWKDDDALRRYTFEEDKLVDSGPHTFGAKAKAREQGVLGGFTRGDGPSYGGGGGGYRRGGGYGGGPPRGGGSWRGR